MFVTKWRYRREMLELQGEIADLKERVKRGEARIQCLKGNHQMDGIYKSDKTINRYCLVCGESKSYDLREK